MEDLGQWRHLTSVGFGWSRALLLLEHRWSNRRGSANAGIQCENRRCCSAVQGELGRGRVSVNLVSHPVRPHGRRSALLAERGARRCSRARADCCGPQLDERAAEIDSPPKGGHYVRKLL